jgi:preprotein translocase subunit SecA
MIYPLMNTASVDNPASQHDLAARQRAWRTLRHQRSPAQLPRNLDRVWDVTASRLVTRWPRRRRYLKRAQAVLAMADAYSKLSDQQLYEQAMSLRALFRLFRETPDTVHQAFAVIRETAARRLGLRPFREQVAAGLAMFDGALAEMATGEGKTLAAVLPAIVLGWRGQGCHLITVNDYLARRDAHWMAPIYEACGVSAAHVEGEMGPAARRAAYGCDVTYATSREVAADFLRDRLSNRGRRDLAASLLRGMVQDREAEPGTIGQLAYAIVDEADSVLIDEAVTPLIISGEAPNAEQTAAFTQAASLSDEFTSGVHYKVNRAQREIRLTETGRRHAAQLCEQLGGLWRGARRREEMLTQALTAREFFIRDKHYVIQDGQVVIVDEFTGRLMPDRTWRDGLHQAVEAKEGLTINDAKTTLARMSFQRFFRHYRQLCGMTGTAWEARHEFWQTYRLPVVRIPTHQPCIRQHHRDRIFTSSQARFNAVIEATQQAHAQGRPVLIGTRTVEDSERLSQMLEARNLAHQVLNAVRHEEEAAIIAQAGGQGCITVATNMAGRGTDIKLEAGVAARGGLHVIATQRHETGRIDRQLFGRAGRQGEPGSAICYVSLDDELVNRHGFLSRLALKCVSWAMTGNGETRGWMKRWLFSHAQAAAERRAQRQRRAVVQQDEWLDETLGFAGPAYRD